LIILYLYYIMAKKVTTSYMILIIWGFLILFGILAVYSVSIHESFTTSLKFDESDPTNYFYFFRHLRNLLVWLVMGVVAYKIPLHWYKKYYVIIFVILLLFQLLVFTPLGDSFGKGARNWINFPWLGTVQPSEFFKLGFVIFLSAWMIRKRQLLTELRW
jgi:cell division protein FtsW